MLNRIWSMICSYNPDKSVIARNLDEVSTKLDFHSSSFDKNAFAIFH